jgi:hypothetical protein
MNDQSPINNTQPEPLDRHEARRQHHEARREFLGGSGGGLTWVAGVILILLGVAFLLQNIGTFSIPLENWWALFILIPALGAFDTARRIYRKSGNQFTASACSSALGGVILTLITASFIR